MVKISDSAISLVRAPQTGFQDRLILNNPHKEFIDLALKHNFATMEAVPQGSFTLEIYSDENEAVAIITPERAEEDAYFLCLNAKTGNVTRDKIALASKQLDEVRTAFTEWQSARKRYLSINPFRFRHPPEFRNYERIADILEEQGKKLAGLKKSLTFSERAVISLTP
jgi:hypothetical protein